MHDNVGCFFFRARTSTFLEREKEKKKTKEKRKEPTEELEHRKRDCSAAHFRLGRVRALFLRVNFRRAAKATAAAAAALACVPYQSRSPFSL